jgi:hypothetical protein
VYPLESVQSYVALTPAPSCECAGSVGTAEHPSPKIIHASSANAKRVRIMSRSRNEERH